MEQPLRRTPHVAMPEPVSHSEPDVLSERSEETLSMQGTEEQEERLAPEIQELQGEVEHTRDELAGAR